MSSEKDDSSRASTSDNPSFKLWVEDKVPNIGRFAYQLGISIKKLPSFQRACLVKLEQELHQWTTDQAEVRLYQVVLEQLTIQSLETTNLDEQNYLGFHEDQELHHALQKLERDQRIAVVLYYFHEHLTTSTTNITGKSESEFINSMDKGLRKLEHDLQLNEQQLTQRLQLLHKSYQRLVPPSPIEEYLEQKNKMINERSITLPETQQSHKKTITVLVATSIFLATVIGVSFLFNTHSTETAEQTQKQQSELGTTEQIEEWRNQYKKIKETSPKRLGMSKQEYEKLSYVKEADAEMEQWVNDKSLQSTATSVISLQDAMSRILQKIETPQGMVDSLSGATPMLSEDVEDFLLNYAAKTDELRVFADRVFQKYAEEVKSTIVMGQLSPEKLLAEAKNYPQELRLVIEALPEYNLFAVAHPQKQHFRTVRNTNELSQQSIINGSWEAFQYLDFITKEPFFDEYGFLFPLEEVPDHLTMIEQSLLEEREDTDLLDEVEVAYHQFFWQLLKGNEINPVFNEQGQVKLEYRSAWNNIAVSNPLAYIMLPILKEMEASDWTDSKAYDDLEFHDLQEAVALEKSAKLADKLPNGNLMFEDEVVDLTDFDYSRIQDLYKSFSVRHDLQLLAGVSPLDVMFMYHYANKLEDPETQWHLLAESSLKPTLTVYKQQWQKIPELTEKAKWVEIFNQANKQRVKEKIYINPQLEMNNVEELDGRYDLWLVTEKDAIWQIDYQLYQTQDLSLDGQQFINAIEILYAKFASDHQPQQLKKASPIEIVAVFFKAVEEKDTETMKKLMANEKDINYEVSLDMFEFGSFSDITQLTFRTYFSPEERNENAGSVEIVYEGNSNKGSVNTHFFLDKTPQGWRLSELFY